MQLVYRYYLIALAAATVALWLATSSELVPYNLRELTGKFPPPFGALGLLVAAMIAFAPTALLGRLLVDIGRMPAWLIPVVLIGHALGLYCILRLVVPLESIDDIVGSVLPYGLAELERALRFGGFFVFISSALSGGVAAWYALRSIRPARIFYWLVFYLVCFGLGYWTIVVEASTDNIIELVRDRGGLIGMFGLSLWFWLTAFHAVLGVQLLSRQLPLRAFVLASLVFLPLAYSLLWLALEPRVAKYQAEFSAMQFLLSPERGDYAEGAALYLRFLVMQLSMLVLMGLAFFPVLRLRSLRIG